MEDVLMVVEFFKSLEANDTAPEFTAQLSGNLPHLGELSRIIRVLLIEFEDHVSAPLRRKVPVLKIAK